MEIVEDRIVPSAASGAALPMATPPAQPSMAAVASSVFSTVDQWVVALEQKVSTIVQNLTQDIAQAEALVIQQWDHLLGIPTGGSGSGSGAAATANNNQNQQLNIGAPKSGSGSGSGAVGTGQDNNSSTGVSKVHPLSGSGSGDVYTWDPQSSGSGSGLTPSNILASDFHNWLKNGQVQLNTGTIPGYKPTDRVLFDGSTSNSPIEWNQSFTFSTMEIGGILGYTGTETFDSGVTVEETGVDGIAVGETAASSVTIKLGNKSNHIEDGDSQWTSFNISSVTPGDLTPQWIIARGTTKLAGVPGPGKPAFTENLGVNLTINGGATLSYQSNNTLNITASNVVITVNGEMDLLYGTGQGITLIQQGNQISGCYIDVTGGTLYYLGDTGVTDILAIPVLVEKNGNFTVTGNGQSYGGWLTVKGQVALTKKYSVYMTSGSVNLSMSSTLECDDDYQQTSGTLQTTDSSYCALQDGASGALGTAVIAGGSLVINGGASKGIFGVDAGNLSFNGRFKVGIQGDTTGQNGQLRVSGNMNNQANSSLSVELNGLLKNGNWTIIDTGGNNIAQFAVLGFPQGTTPKNNQPQNGDYEVTSP